MGKVGKIILIVFVLIVIAAPLAYLIKHNFSQRLAKITSQGIDIGLGLNTLPAIDQAKEAAALSDKTTQDLEQAIKDLTQIATSSPEATSTENATTTN